MDVALLTFLILLNGLFAMSEMALAASRKARLQVMAESGDAGARAAIALHESPTQFLSTVQIGITSIGVLNGIVGEAAFSGPLAHWLMAHFPIPDGAAQISATGLVVVIITVRLLTAKCTSAPRGKSSKGSAKGLPLGLGIESPSIW